MCCRFYIDKESPEMQKIIAQMNRSPLMQRWPSTQSEAFVLDAQTSSLQASFLSSRTPEAQLHGSLSPTALSDARVALWGWSVFYGSAAGEHTGRRRIDGTYGFETIVRNDTEGNREGQPADGTVSDTK